jgi:hypothetical protein
VAPPDRPTPVAATQVSVIPAPLRQGWALPVAGWGVTLGALLAIVLGVGYDLAEREPGRFTGLLILGGLALLTGAPWWLLGVWSGQVRRWAAHHEQEDR